MVVWLFSAEFSRAEPPLISVSRALARNTEKLTPPATYVEDGEGHAAGVERGSNPCSGGGPRSSKPKNAPPWWSGRAARTGSRPPPLARTGQSWSLARSAHYALLLRKGNHGASVQRLPFPGKFFRELRRLVRKGGPPDRGIQDLLRCLSPPAVRPGPASRAIAAGPRTLRARNGGGHHRGPSFPAFLASTKNLWRA